jgi:hypothetical protein
MPPVATSDRPHTHLLGRRQSRWLPIIAVFLIVRPASALDKQGSAHGGAIEGADSGVDLSGAFAIGISLYNPTYAARPDNSGLSLLRYAWHGDLDLVGRRLSIPVDVNAFTDGQLRGARKLAPTEIDVIAGVTTTWPLGPGAIELGSRVEHDREIGPGVTAEETEASGGLVCGRGAPCSQTYIDARARYLYSLAHAVPGLGDTLADGDVSGWLTLGWFVHNPSYAARPDNAGLALLRYAIHTEISFFHDYVSFAVDATMFTDRHFRPLRPSELDLTPEIIGHFAPFELHLAYERDMPVGSEAPSADFLPQGRRGLVQSFAYGLFVWKFDLTRTASRPLGDHTQIPSP